MKYNQAMETTDVKHWKRAVDEEHYQMVKHQVWQADVAPVWEKIQCYQEIANQAAKRELGPPRGQHLEKILSFFLTRRDKTVAMK
jgi:hypothetical protein